MLMQMFDHFIYIFILQTLSPSVEMKLSTKMFVVVRHRIRLNETVPMSAIIIFEQFLESTYIFFRYLDTSVGVKLSTKIYVVVSQTNHLNETVQTSTLNTC